MECHKEPVFRLGENTLAVPMSLFANNRKRLCIALNELEQLPDRSIVLLQGGEQKQNYIEPAFRQESYFHWCFGVLEPNCYGCIDVTTGKTTLFIVKWPASSRLWMDENCSLTRHFQAKYAVDKVGFVEDIAATLKNMNMEVLLTMKGSNKARGLALREACFKGIDNFTVDNQILHPVISECRVFKSNQELEVLRYVNRVSCEAHKEVMRRIKLGWMEYQAESLYRHLVYTFGGCRHVAYVCTAACGAHGAVDYYGDARTPNNGLVKDGDMCMFDMSGEYYCYVSDITCSYPANGKFTDDQRAIYSAVLKSNKAVQKALKPGVSPIDMQLLADRIHLEELSKMGLLRGDVGEMMKVCLGEVFMPIGVGHFIGHDLLDVEGNSDENELPRTSDAGIRRLSMTRTMQAGMVVTVEPGIYFCWPVIEEALNNPSFAKFMNAEAIQRFRNFGAVRIEDNVAITENGIDMLTIIPREIDEIEALMQEGSTIKDRSAIGTILPGLKA